MSDGFELTFVGLLCILFFMWGHSCGKDNGYEQGQIDAMKGQYKYEAQVDTVYIEKPE